MSWFSVEDEAGGFAAEENSALAGGDFPGMSDREEGDVARWLKTILFIWSLY